MTKEELGSKIAHGKIRDKIAWIDSHGLRGFDRKRDQVHVSLSRSQWAYVSTICEPTPHTSFKEWHTTKPILGFTVRFRYNDRMDCWEGYGKHWCYKEEK